MSIYYFSSSWEPGVWKSRLYVKTGLIPESGVRYHVTADVESDMDMPFEILFNDGEVEKGFGALYGQNLAAGEKKTCEAVITGGSEGEELVLQFSLGEAPEDANVKVGNVRIETVTDHYKNILPAGFALDKEVFTGRTLTSLVPTSYKNIPLNVSYSGSETVREFHDPDFEASLEKAADSATYRITRARESNRGVWEAKLFVDTGFTPEPGKLYEVKFDLDSEKDQEKYEICFDGAGGDNEKYGAIKPELPDSLKLKAGQRSSVDYLFSTDADHGPLTIRIQLGETNTAEGNTVKISGLELREISSTGTELTLPGFGYPDQKQDGQETDVEMPGFAYPEMQPAQETNVEMPGFAYPVTTGGDTQHVEDAWVNLPVTLSSSKIEWGESKVTDSVLSGSSAQLVITEPSHEADAPWTVRLHIGTGLTLEPGKQYKIEANFSATDPTDKWECKLSNGPADVDGEYPNQYGSGYGYVMDSSDQTAAIAHTITVPADLPCKELVLRFDLGRSGTNTITVSDIKVSEFVPAHDEIIDPVTTPNSFVLEPRNGNETSDAQLSGNGSSATAKVIAPSPSGDDWHIKLIANTGAELQEGKKYVISMKVNGTGDGEWPIAYRRDMEGDHDYDFSPDTNVNPDDSLEFLDGGVVRNTVTARYSGKLQIVLKLGKRAAGSTITVSDISIKEITAGSGSVNSFKLETNEGTVGELSGDGSSATAHITKPGDDWHIKLYAKTGLKLEAGKTYEISMDVANADGCMACFKDLATGSEEGFGSKAVSSGTVSHQVSPATSGELEILLKLGTVPADTDVKVSNVKVSELSLAPGENLLSGFKYNSVGSVSDATDDGYITSLEKKSDSAVFHIHQAPAEERHPWNVKLNVKTGFTPENGKGYRVSFDLAAEKPQAVAEVFYDGNKENAYGQLFNRSLSAGTQNISFTTRPMDSNGELTLQIRLGQTDGTDGNTYTVSNVKIEEVTFTSYSTPEKRETTTLRTEAGYRSQLDKTADRATVRIEKTPSTGLEAWKTKLFVETGVTLKAGQKYRIRMDVKSIIPAPFEVCFNNGGEEKGLGAMFGLLSSPAGQPVEYVTYPRQDIQLVIQLSLGNCTSPNSIILSNLAVEKAGTINLVSDTIYEF